ncbi:hypothetical protein H0H92_003921 [Tricholoma furcatifolium]|nr:hypothetical protein H0H92_003921 [Tricholoma furcatifolium]
MPFIPQIVADHLKNNNIELVRVGASDDTPAPLGHSLYITADDLKVFQNNDALTLQELRKQNYADIKPILNAIKAEGPSAFTTAYDVDNKNQQYELCQAANGVVWVYVDSIQPDPKSSGKLVATVSCGTFSYTNSWLGISSTVLGDLGAQVTVAILSTVATTLVGRFIFSRLAGQSYDVAAAEASEAAEASVEDFVTIFPEWAATGLGFLGGLVAGAVAAVILFLIIELFLKSYQLQVQVINWSTQEEWDVVEWYGDNADMSGPFEVGNLSVASDHTFAEGVGMALKVVSKNDATRVILLKYVVRWIGSNWIGLAVGTQNSNLGDFYNDSSSWASNDPLTASITVPAGSGSGTPETPVSCMTPALAGVSDDSYYFDVTIATPPKQS